MTYFGVEADEISSLGLNPALGDGDRHYVTLGGSEGHASGRLADWRPWRSCSLCCWLKLVVFSIFLSVAVAAFVLWGFPIFLQKVVTPILNWEIATFSTPVLGLILFVAFAICPAVLIPSSPFMWLAGIKFGYGYGFMLIMAGISIGMSLPFFIGSLFRHKINKWLERWPKQAAIIRLAGEGNWLHQFRAVALIRISPFPYIIFNYAAVATNVKYFPYMCGSMVGTVPEVFLTIYSGILIRNLAEATNKGGFVSVEQLLYDALGFCAAAAATAAITIYAKSTLRTLQLDDELR